MPKKALLAAATLLALAPGCASLHELAHGSGVAATQDAAATQQLDARFRPSRLTAGQCDLEKCEIFVSVKQEGGKCVPEADPDLVKLTHRGVDVFWTLRGAYRFPPARGIAFKDSGHPFSGSHRVSDTQWTWKGTGRPGGYYPYSITLIDAKGQECVSDPGLIPNW
jgi:hypothetical protein